MSLVNSASILEVSAPLLTWQLSFTEKLLYIRHRARPRGQWEERQSYVRKANLMKKTDKQIKKLAIDKLSIPVYHQ